MTKILQKIWDRLFGRSEKSWHIVFEIINPEILRQYHDSAHYLAEFILQNKKPNGTMFFSGREKEGKIEVDYNAHMIQPEEIKKFILESGVKAKEIKREPFKRFFGLEYMASK